MARLIPDRENRWPHLLSEGYEVTSKDTPDYNCIAFAAGVTDQWWEPDINGLCAWPIVRREYSIDCFIEAFKTQQYEVCEPGFEPDHERIAFYALNGQITHAARQIEDGKWTSKLGDWEDIQHTTTKAVEEYIYGKAVVFMKRKRTHA